MQYENNDNIVYNLNSLYQAYLCAKRNSDWKPQVQKYEMDFLPNIVKSKELLKSKTYVTKESTEFIINERGKTRPITGLQMSDRVIRHSLCDNVLSPAILPYIIYDNGASVKTKGISFSRQRFETHIHKYYQQHRNNDGYILLMDYSKFYDNIPHELALQQISRYVHDDFSLWLLRMIFDNFKIDVSYMTNAEYERCKDKPFNSIEYRLTVPKSKRTGEKYLNRSVNIGDQCSQIIGIFYPTPIDNFIKIVKHQKYYGRYMDDSYIIADNKELLYSLLLEITDEASKLGIVLNQKKTHIEKLSGCYKFLQISYSLTESGKLIRKINPERITKMRRKLKKLSVKVKNGECTQQSIENMFKSWMCSNCHIMSKMQRDNLNILYYELFGGFIDGKYFLRYYPRRRNKNPCDNKR